MPPQLKAGTRFEVPDGGKHKYVALVPDPDAPGGVRRVKFGARAYEHYADQVPPELGGGRWAALDHGDPERRRRYRLRHGAQGYQTRRYSPAWFSWHFLW